MTSTSIIEVVVAVGLIAGGIWQYRRRGAVDSRHGSQSAVLLFAVGAIMLIHGTGLLEYRPSPSEIRQ